MSKLDMSIVMINLLAVENVSLSLIILIRNSYNGVEQLAQACLVAGCVRVSASFRRRERRGSL